MAASEARPFFYSTYSSFSVYTHGRARDTGHPAPSKGYARATFFKPWLKEKVRKPQKQTPHSRTFKSAATGLSTPKTRVQRAATRGNRPGELPGVGFYAREANAQRWRQLLASALASPTRRQLVQNNARFSLFRRTRALGQQTEGRQNGKDSTDPGCPAQTRQLRIHRCA